MLACYPKKQPSPFIYPPQDDVPEGVVKPSYHVKFNSPVSSLQATYVVSSPTMLTHPAIVSGLPSVIDGGRACLQFLCGRKRRRVWCDRHAQRGRPRNDTAVLH
eukprot:6941107-Pyramimonas_sp.AAC.1